MLRQVSAFTIVLRAYIVLVILLTDNIYQSNIEDTHYIHTTHNIS